MNVLCGCGFIWSNPVAFSCHKYKNHRTGINQVIPGHFQFGPLDGLASARVGAIYQFRTGTQLPNTHKLCIYEQTKKCGRSRTPRNAHCQNTQKTHHNPSSAGAFAIQTTRLPIEWALFAIHARCPLAGKQKKSNVSVGVCGGV